jgi:hypothetical protein
MIRRYGVEGMNNRNDPSRSHEHWQRQVFDDNAYDPWSLYGIEAFALEIPSPYDQEWWRDVWNGVVRDDQSTASTVDPQTQPLPSLPTPREGTTIYDLCRCVQYFFKTYHNGGYFVDTKERRRRLRVCVEAAASLVCCAGVRLDLFGEVGEVLSEIGDKEWTKDPLTIRSNSSFTVRWTCLSLVAIWKSLDDNRVQELAKFSLDGIARFQTDYDRPDTVALTAAQRIDDYLKRAWASAVDLLLAFEPWDQSRTETEIRWILNSRKASISKLERIATEAVGMEDIDWRISLLQETMDGATHKLVRRLPGAFFTDLRHTSPNMMSEAFVVSESFVETTPVPPQLIFPGQQIQSICTLGQRLRDIIEGQNTEMHEETLKSLESLREIPFPLRGRNDLMKRQLWRLLDLRDGRGLGFIIEFFFIAFRQLSSTPSSSKLKVFYTGTFKVITSNWEKSKESVGTQRILLELLTDLVIRSRGVFSDFPYPPYIVDMLLDLVGKMIKGPRSSHRHINDVIQELEDEISWKRMDNGLRDKVLGAIYLSSDTAPS